MNPPFGSTDYEHLVIRTGLRITIEVLTLFSTKPRDITTYDNHISLSLPTTCIFQRPSLP